MPNFGKTAIPKLPDTKGVERHDPVLKFLQLLPVDEATFEDICNWPDESCASDCSAYLAGILRSEFKMA